VNYVCSAFDINQSYDCLLSSSTYQSTGRAVAVKYTQGEWEGELGTDRITIPKGPNGTITINIASILTSEGFFLPGINWQGILGLAYPLLVRVSHMMALHGCFVYKRCVTLSVCANCLIVVIM